MTLFSNHVIYESLYGCYQELVCREVSDLADYMNPAAPAALLKCAIVYCR